MDIFFKRNCCSNFIGLTYPQKNIQENTIEWQELKENGATGELKPKAGTLEEFEAIKTAILRVTLKRGHTLDGNEPWIIDYIKTDVKDDTFGIIYARSCANKGKIVGLDLVLNYSSGYLAYIELNFSSSIPNIFKNIREKNKNALCTLKNIRYSTKELHNNRLIFEKNFFTHGVPNLIIQRFIEFVDLDDRFKKMNTIQRDKLFCGFFRECKKPIIPGIQKIFNEYTVGKDKNEALNFKE